MPHPDEVDDKSNKNGSKQIFDGTFRRLSAAFEAMEAAERDALENSSSDEDEERERKSVRDAEEEDEENDQFELGEEGSEIIGLLFC